MTRRRYIQDPNDSTRFYLQNGEPPEPRVYVRGDHADFVSPVDRTVVHGRKSLREHNKRNNVINVDEYGNGKFCEPEALRERKRYYDGESREVRKGWRESLLRAMEIHKWRS